MKGGFFDRDACFRNYMRGDLHPQFKLKNAKEKSIYRFLAFEL